MNIFENILEIKTWRKELVIKAVYVPNSISEETGSYFVYYYDLFTHSFYINDLDKLCNNTRTKAINIIENIVSQAYKQEMNSLAKILKHMQMGKKPQVFCIYEQPKTKEVIIDKISFKYTRNLNWRITGFKNPKWDNSLDDTLKMLGLK